MALTFQCNGRAATASAFHHGKSRPRKCPSSFTASVKLSELAIGIGPFVVGPVIEKKIGLGAYSAMSVDADWRSAEWGANAGLYAALAPDVAALDKLVADRTAWLAQMNPAAMKQLKQVFWEGTADWDALLGARAEMSGTLVLTEPAQVAIRKT